MQTLCRLVLGTAAAVSLTAGRALGAPGAEEQGGGEASHLPAAQEAVRHEELRGMNPLYSSPWTVNPGHVQMESYVVQYARDHDHEHRRADTTRETWLAGPVTLKAGVLHDLDVEATFTPYIHSRTHDRLTHGSAVQEGSGDLLAAVKYNIYGNDTGHGALAALPYIKFPTSQDGLGNDFVEGGLVLPVAFELPAGWWLIVSPEVDVAHNDSSAGYHADFGNTVYICHSIVGNLSGYADMFSSVSTGRHAGALNILDFGLSWTVTANAQIDLGISLAMTRAGDDVNPYLGFSFRY